MLTKIKNTLNNNKGAAVYLEVIMNVVIFAVLLVITIYAYNVMKSYSNLQHSADFVVDVIAHNGQINTDADKAMTDMKDKLGSDTLNFTIEVTEYFDVTTKTIQLGDTITVYAEDTFYLHSGFEGIKIPIKLKAFKTAISERYWK